MPFAALLINPAILAKTADEVTPKAAFRSNEVVSSNNLESDLTKVIGEKIQMYTILPLNWPNEAFSCKPKY